MFAINERRSDTVGFDQAKKLAVKDFLADYLGYNKEELDELMIAETKIAPSGDDIINVAFASHDDTRELHIRRAESQNEEITVCNYIPPNFYERYTHLNKVCQEMRQKDNTLRTQLRFGKKDIEVFTKHKGDPTGFRVVKLDDFTDISKIPKL